MTRPRALVALVALVVACTLAATAMSAPATTLLPPSSPRHPAAAGGFDGGNGVPAVAPNTAPTIRLAVGRVVNAQGFGLSGLQIVVSQPGGPIVDTAVTDDLGFFDVIADVGHELDVLGTSAMGIPIVDPDAPILVVIDAR